MSTFQLIQTDAATAVGSRAPTKPVVLGGIDKTLNAAFAVVVPAQPHKVYRLVEAQTQQLVKGQRLVRKGNNLLVEVDGATVVNLTGFFNTDANATITLSARATDGSSRSFTAMANASGVWAIDTANPPNAQTALAANKVWVFSATQTDVAGNTSAVSTSQTVNFDTSIATPTISNLADNASTNRQVTLSGTGEASNLLGNVTVKVYDGSTLLGSTTTDFMGGWTFTTPALSAGAHTLKVEQLDAAGNLSAQLSKPITVDTTILGAPMLSADGLRIANTANGNNRLTPSSPFEVTAAGGSAVSFWAKLDSSNNFANLNGQLVSGGGLANYELFFRNGSLFLWRGADLLVPNFTPDTNWHQYVISHDGLGNASLYIDGVLRFTPGGSSTSFNNLSLTFGSHADPNNPSNLNGSMRDIKVWDVSLSQTQVTALSQGLSTGQESQIKAAYALLGDTTATTGPALTVTGTMTANAADTGILGDNITNSKVFSLTGQAAANATIEIWDSAANGNSFFVQRVVADSTGAWRANMSNQTQGAHNYVARQLNADGTTLDSAATTVTIDTTPPSAPTALSLTAASNSGLTSDTITNNTTPTLSGTAEGNAWVSVFQAGNLVGKVQAGTNGVWNFTVPRALADGSYSFTARQEDTAGNVSPLSSALSVTVDTKMTAPTLTNSGAQPGNSLRIDTFDTDNSGWTMVTAGRNATTGKITASGGANLMSLQDANLAAGATYYLSFDYTMTGGSNLRVCNNTTGALADYLFGQNLSPTANGTGTGTMSGYFVAAANKNSLSISADWNFFTGTIDNFRLYKVSGLANTLATQPWLSGTGEAGATITFYDNGSTNALGTTTVGSNGLWNFPTTIVSSSHSIRYTQTDIAGNVSALSNPYVFSITTPPVVIDLNRDGVLSYSQAVIDVNRDGQLDHSAWVAPQDGVLVWDKFHDGQVRDASQYVFSQGQGQTDLQGLAAQFDTNRDGVFDAQDALFTEFAVWQDSNQNGVSDAGEVRSLADVGLTAIRLQSDGVARQTAPGVHEAGRSSATASDGSSVLVGDAAFDFTSLTSVAASSASRGQIDLASDTSANLLQLSLQDLLALPEQNGFNTSNTQAISGTPLAAGARQLMITGDKTDVVKLDANTWSASNTVIAHAGHQYQVYTANTSHAQLLIDQTIVNAGHVL